MKTSRFGLFMLLYMITAASEVIFINPSELKEIRLGIDEVAEISWNVLPKNENYVESHLIFRKNANSQIIMKFNSTGYFGFKNVYSDEIISMGPKNILLQRHSDILDEVLISIENLYLISANEYEIEVFDYLPIYVVYTPKIKCRDPILSGEGKIRFGCVVESKPEAFINIGFEKIPPTYDFDKKTKINSKKVSVTEINVQFDMRSTYIGRAIYISAASGSYDDFLQLRVPNKTIPFDVQLFIQERTLTYVILKPYRPEVKNVHFRCSAKSYDKEVDYTIVGPGNFRVNEETARIDLLISDKHAGIWKCIARNNMGEAMSPEVSIEFYIGKPEQPDIYIEGYTSKNYTFSVNSKQKVQIKCVSGASPQVNHYTLQRINSGSGDETLQNENGVFFVWFDTRYSENIFLCKSENPLGKSLPTVFNIRDLQNSWQREKSPLIRGTFLLVICGLSITLIISTIYLSVKLTRDDEYRSVLWDIFSCGPCVNLLNRSHRYQILKDEYDCSNPEKEYQPRRTQHNLELQSSNMPEVLSGSED